MIKLPLILFTILNMHAITDLMKDNNNHNHNPLIESTCRNTPNDNLCVSTLQANPNGLKADNVEGICLVLVDAIKAKAEAAMSKIDRLKRDHPELSGELDQCRRTYYAVVEGDVPQAEAGLVKGVPKFSEEGMRDAAWEADICERGFEGESPLSGDNEDLRDLAMITAHIVRKLL